MEIISRNDALSNGLKTYYTGELCKNGHKTYRYTQSGSCSKCVNSERVVSESNLVSRIIALRMRADALEAQLEKRQRENLDTVIEMRDKYNERKQRKELLKSFTQIKIMVNQPDIANAKALLMAYIMPLNAEITIDEVWLDQKPKVGVLYRILCPDEAIKPIVDWCNITAKAHHAIDDRLNEIHRDTGAVMKTIDYSINDEYRT